MLNKQWLGKYEDSTQQGGAILNLDHINNIDTGQLFFINPNTLSMGATIKFTDLNHAILYNFYPLDYFTYTPLEIGSYINSYPGIVVTLPTEGKVKLTRNNYELTGTWKNNLSEGELILHSSPFNHTKFTTYTWNDFKDYVGNLNSEEYIYRGQPNLKPLQTSFHRTSRSDLIRYDRDDVPDLRRHVCAILNTTFNLYDPQEYLALLSLGQHHGFPTPLLDWTRSVYIAAYFAFSNDMKQNDYVSIYIFKYRQWIDDTEQVNNITQAKLSLTIRESLSLYNQRVIPQQSILMFSTVDDVRTFIQKKEEEKEKEYLIAIKLLASEQKTVLTDLNHMGINAGSMFPGLDGACKALKERNFILI